MYDRILSKTKKKVAATTATCIVAAFILMLQVEKKSQIHAAYGKQPGFFAFVPWFGLLQIIAQ